ncbi:MAG: tetratricopeptide repeat protein [Myxococcales bacterium]|nr:tetratricopeptide repeat protein [Myxococcales bacterium]
MASTWVALRRATGTIGGAYLTDACLQAGRGLIAAHEAGLVHRDFKPSNVLCAADGRVLVADFGLTKLLRPGPSGGDGAKTRASGTPGYAAPEQARGEASTAKSDQFSYCVTLYQCLLGRPPYGSGASEAETASTQKSEKSGALGMENRSGANAPKGMGAIVSRGMSTRAGERYPSMQVLLGQLERIAHRRRRLGVILVSVACAAAIGISMFSLGQRAKDEENVCAKSTASVHDVWNSERQAQMARVLVTSPYQGHARHFMTSLGNATQGLSREHAAACEATFGDHAQSAELYDRQMLCLGRLVTELSVIVQLVEGGGSVEMAQLSLGRLGSPSDCHPSELMLNAQAPPKDPAVRQRIRVVEATMAESRMLARKNKSEGAVRRMELAVESAESIDYGPFRARTLLSYSQVLVGLERFDDARSASEGARDAAAKSRDTVLLVRALLQLAEHVSTHGDNAVEGAAFVDTAKAISSGISLPTYFQATMHRSAAIVARSAEEGETASAEAALALRILDSVTEDLASPRGMEMRVSLLSIIASAQFDAGDYESALHGFEEIAVLQRKRLGPKHSGAASPLVNLATLQYKLGKLVEAHTTLLDAKERLSGPEASQAALARCPNLEGLILTRSDRVDDAITVYREAIKVQTKVYGTDHRMIWSTRNNLANALVEKEEWDEAIALHEAQVAWSSARAGEKSSKSIIAKINHANTLAQASDSNENLLRASELIRELLPLMEADDRRRINVLSVQAQVAFRREEFREAADAYAKAIDLADSMENVRESLKAYLLVSLSQTYWRLGEKRRSLNTAARALEIYKGIPEKVAARAELEEWIAERE